ncbi:hypothetical protein K490DRAFT_57690 [Saccharata proteae CBS 121410]|uniref:Uncharacterized protein n=1 Tax=Saccharata proteae CBS 121410 TaxID=1314787 RepID=A0A9P4HU56_9PEZI|nr:hypothetical protein K490DRAFT_57690 [Saccharata proteae CBS 121410]
MTTSVTETERAIMVPKSTPELAGEWRGSLGNGVFKPKLNVRPRHSRFFPPQDVIKAPMAGKQIQQSPMEAKEELSVAKEALDNQHDHSAVAPPLTIESDHTTMPSRLQPEDTEEWRALLRLGGSIAADYDRCWDQYEGEAGFENVDAEIQDDDWTVLFC